MKMTDAKVIEQIETESSLKAGTIARISRKNNHDSNKVKLHYSIVLPTK